MQGARVRRLDCYRGRAVRHGSEGNLDEALASLSPDELRAFVRDALTRLDPGPRGELEDLLVQRAVNGASGWRPAAPPAAFVDEARTFIAAARKVAQADPSDVDDVLRQALTASFAGDHVSARAVFEAVLEPICGGDVFLGQDEMVSEVLSVSLQECACRFMAAVYVTTPLTERADAIIAANEVAGSSSYLHDPLEEIAKALGGAVPDLEAFLPLWIARLERDAKSSASDWESEHERWLRAAIGRRDGVAGLAQLARTTKRSEAADAWCKALVEKRDWSSALAAYEECAALVDEDYAKGKFLDGAARAAQQLGRTDLLSRLEASWLGAPSLLRLVRWLASGSPTASTVRRRAGKALEACPTKAPPVERPRPRLVEGRPPRAPLVSRVRLAPRWRPHRIRASPSGNRAACPGA